MNMDKIERYIKLLSKNVYLSPKELDDFQDEIRNHLLDTVKELQQQGKSVEDSINIALDRFGAEKFINTELRKVVQFQNKLKNSMLKVSGLFLAISLLFLTFYQFLEQKNSTDFDKMQLQYHNQIEKRIVAEETINIEEIKTFFSQNKRILRSVHLVKTDSLAQTTEYVYPSNTTKEQLNQQPYISYPIQMGDRSTKWDVKIALESKVLFSQAPNVVFILSVICFVTYWILYGLWNIMNAYRMGRLNTMWVLLFFTLNIFAYLLFKLEEKFKMRGLKVAA
ncbi:MAG: hypothetical protein H7X86_08725 [Gorillibacterium sp.]|nr:hypothetical protein [Gorillibacterium sp.]